ncbi:MAG: hypothetical protein A3C84_01605 [Candidatus Ryanbacteria bacterium RIFCSPHIGHO2_02_FULL_48_12]|uniref:Uncharacterized protein n=1 Tax=Candidatus Ryanbacteria bacterium RIFCSPHIGHO2_01_FULL_48_27 TaxID=1802115 RepID=A0A1G2G7G6_9BACT|nr:MAG: hypothetical protein A2756_06340 [Candidatus Ryanbacteria bacterium RIFCSPHIGHO2_01_FULL_48_27]OGZ49177.1 MAG: hypothetical protein A3C84_01605 [Candidatus Ryanbacteria bacterium RIFCSPHIGHO2_02_FULL_48_12]
MPVKSIKRSFAKKAFLAIFIVGCIGAVAVILAAVVFIFTLDVPSIDSFKEREVVQSTKIYDRTGEIPLFEIYGEEKRTVIPFAEIPRNAKNATLAIEDSRFYSHAGVSIIGILRAFFTDLLHGRFLVQGGSTITQQLVKKTLLTSEHTITRKIKEAVLATKMETIYSKDEILNLYLNQIPYGSNAYGIEAASLTFFSKHARDLTLAEAAYLAAMVNAPSYYSPYGNHRSDLDQRKNTVLNRMADLGYIDDTEAGKAKEEHVIFLPYKEQGIKAPHFVMYVIEQLNEVYGEDFVKKNGLKITTSLDVPLQKKAEETVTTHAAEIEKNFNAKNTGLVSLNPKTGEILAMVGSRDYFNIKEDGNFNVTLANRQPGSAFKPIVYATGFKKGYTPDTVLFDVETEFAVQGAESYKPKNYDNIFRGPISLRDALAQSINIPAVKLLYLVGIKDAINTAKDLGITTIEDPNRYGLTLVLGGGEVRLLDLTSAYGVFANDGVRNHPISILKIEKSDGTILEEYKPEPKEVLNVEVARTISDILSDNKARTPAYGANSALYFPDRDVAVKTGTTNDYRDTWVIGYTPNLVTGVWAGNNDNSSMEKKVAGLVVAPIWHDFMARAFTNIPKESFTKPQPNLPTKPILRGIWKGGQTYRIDKISGEIAKDQTPPELIEERVVEDIHSILYWVNKNDPLGPTPTNPWADSQFANWENGVRAWVQGHNITTTPTGNDATHTTENKPLINVQYPQQNQSVPRNTILPIQLSIQSTYPVRQIDYFVNGVFSGSAKENFTQFTIDLSTIDQSTTNIVVKIKTYDTIGNTNEQTVTLTLS